MDIKSGRRYHLMDEAVLTGNQAIVRQVYMRAQLLTWLRWKSRLPHLLDILEEIPVSLILCVFFFLFSVRRFPVIW